MTGLVRWIKEQHDPLDLLATVVLAGFGIWVAFAANNIASRQNEIAQRQVDIADRQADIAERQTSLQFDPRIEVSLAYDFDPRTGVAVNERIAIYNFGGPVTNRTATTLTPITACLNEATATRKACNTFWVAGAYGSAENLGGTNGEILRLDYRGSASRGPAIGNLQRFAQIDAECDEAARQERVRFACAFGPSLLRVTYSDASEVFLQRFYRIQEAAIPISEEEGLQVFPDLNMPGSERAPRRFLQMVTGRALYDWFRFASPISATPVATPVAE